MKIKTSELTGAALNWAVAMCEGWQRTTARDHTGNYPWLVKVGRDINPKDYRPSTNWMQGGPIIERECICIARLDPQEDEFGNRSNDFWVAHIDGIYCRYGVSAIVAAMRCYVASKKGDEVDVPEEVTL